VKTVFILGAGASVESGAPLMADFLQRAKQLHGANAYGPAAAQVQDVLNAAYKDLRPIHAKSTIDYENVEELFSAIDIAQLIRRFGSRPSDTIDELRKSIVVFIYRTIEETVRIPFDGITYRATKGYDDLARHVWENVNRTAQIGLKEVSFITFNYDTCLELALERQGLGVDYGLSEPFIMDDFANKSQVKIPVLKLHGSINWATCSKCKTVIPTEVNPWGRKRPFPVIDQGRALALPLGTRIAGQSHVCGTPLDPLPLLVPPTWTKSSSTGGLRDVWKRAAMEIGSAENIVVIGYSFPITDMFFKYLFALGSDSDTHLEKFIVVNGPQGESTRDKFEDLLGPMSSRGFAFYPFVFSGAGHIIKDVLGV